VRVCDYLIIMAALRSRCGHYIFALWFLLSSIFFIPRLISAVADWMSIILPHMVWRYCEFRKHVWNVLQAACWKYMYRMQKIAKNSPSGHHRTTLSGYIFATTARIDNRQVFFPIVDTCLTCENLARQSCAIVPRWRFLATFLRPVFSASRVRQVSDLHLKFELRPHYVWKYGRHPNCGSWD